MRALPKPVKSLLLLLAATTILFWACVGLYFLVLFARTGFDRDFLRIKSCVDGGGRWNHAQRQCEH